MSRSRKSAIVAASVAALLLAAWWAQREPGARLPEFAPRAGAVGASAAGEGDERPREVVAAEALRATREVAALPEGEEAAAEGDAGEVEIVGARRPEDEALPVLRYGRIIDADSGRSLPQAYVARGDGAWKGDVVPDQVLARCDSDGRFTMTLVPTREWGNAMKIAGADGLVSFGVLIAVAEGYERHAFNLKQLSEDSNAPTEIALARGATLLARIVDRRGVPQYDVDIDLIGNHGGRLWICAATDELGEVRFVGLPPGVAFEVTLRPRRGPRLRPWLDPKPLKLEAGEERKQEWRLGSGAIVRGRALDQHGRPVAKQEFVLTQKPGGRAEPAAARVYLDGNETHKLALVATSDDEGRFAFDEVAEGAWWLGPARTFQGPNVPVDPQGVAAVAQRIEVAAGVATVDVDLAFHRGLHVGGKVVNSAGQPVRAIVRAKASGASFEGAVSASSEEDGTFLLGPLEPGTFAFTAEGMLGMTSSAVEIAVATFRDDVSLEVSAIATVVLRSLREEQVNVTVYLDGAPQRTLPFQGEMTFELPLPTGRIRVRWSAGERTGEKEFDLAPKERVEVVVGE